MGKQHATSIVNKDTSPTWLQKAKLYMGEKEVPGPHDNPFVLDCFKHTDYHAIHDEVPWCAAFICRVLEECGFKSTRSAAAISYANYGIPCEAKPGAIVVFKWPSGGHHVSIVNRVISPTLVDCLGGNQSHMVKDSTFNRHYVIATRWP